MNQLGTGREVDVIANSPNATGQLDIMATWQVLVENTNSTYDIAGYKKI